MFFLQDQTKHTLNAMVDKLMKFPNMTFIWAESVFLELWWRDLDASMKQAVRRLVCTFVIIIYINKI